jgi:holo-[acyl-carrier protein] synthase
VTGPGLPQPPSGTTELGIDIIRVDRIVRALKKHGRRFPLRILTAAEDAYVRDRPENLAGRWAAKEAVSKVLGLGVRGVGWREIEIVRLPTGQPSVRLHDRAQQRAQQLGMERIAVSISHEHEYAVAIAFGVRTAGGRYVFPLDIDARLDDREQQLLGRLERLRQLDGEVRAAEAAARGEGQPPAGITADSTAGEPQADTAVTDPGADGLAADTRPGRDAPTDGGAAQP